MRMDTRLSEENRTNRLENTGKNRRVSSTSGLGGGKGRFLVWEKETGGFLV